jgi:uncharacterized delta-60 repeat protein
MVKMKFGFWIFFKAASVVSIFAQSPGDLDHSFQTGARLDGSVLSIAVQPDGKVLFAGHIYQGIARVQSNGEQDSSFDPGSGPDRSIWAISLQSDGKVLIGGGFTMIDDRPMKGVARLNSDGSLDTSFQTSLIAGNFDHRVYAVALQSDGKVLVGGLFNTVDGVSRNGIARLNPDGTLDPSFDPGSGVEGSMFTGVYALELQSDGKIVIAGSFTTLNGINRSAIARLNTDGSLDSSFTPPTVPTSSAPLSMVTHIGLQPDGKMITLGHPTAYLARFHMDGSFDRSLPSPFNIRSIALQPDGKLLISGEEFTLSGQSRQRIARLDSDGNLDPGFDAGTNHKDAPAHIPAVYALQIQPDGKVLIGGTFTSIGSAERDRIARLNEDGTLDTSFDASGSGVNDDVNIVVAQPDGRVLIARLQADGTLDRTFNPGTGLLWESNPSQTSALSIALQPDGKVLVAGRFSQVNGAPRSALARFNPDGTLDESFTPLLTSNHDLVEVQAIALQSDNRILIAGEFIAVNGTSRNRIARLNSDGSLDPGFDPGAGPALDSLVYPPSLSGILLQPDGKIVVRGLFTRFHGNDRAGLARLHPDGTLDTSFQFGPEGADRSIFALALQPDGKIIIGGSFNMVNGVVRNHLARLHQDGALDSPFDPGTIASGDETIFTAVNSIIVQPDGNILVAGEFLQNKGASRDRIARLNHQGNLDPAFDPGRSANREIKSITLQTNGKVLVSGAFTGFSGQPRARVARLHGNAEPGPLVLAAPQMHPDGFFHFTFPTNAKQNYTIQISSNLATWTDLVTLTSENASVEFTDANPSPGPRFYRVKSE